MFKLGLPKVDRCEPFLCHNQPAYFRSHWSNLKIIVADFDESHFRMAPVACTNLYISPCSGAVERTNSDRFEGHTGARCNQTLLCGRTAREILAPKQQRVQMDECECERHPHFEGFTRLILFLLQLGTTDHSCCTRQIRRFGLRGGINEDVKNSEKRIGIFSRRRFSRTRCTSLLMILLPFLQLSAVAIPYSRAVSRTRPARRSSVR